MLLVSKSMSTIQEMKDALSREYLMSDLGEARRFLGMEIKITKPAKGPWTISVGQERYITDILNRFGLYQCRGMDTPMAENGRMDKAPSDFQQDPGNVTTYLQMLGCLMYAMTCTRPDLAFTMSHLSQFSQNPTYEHMKALKRVYHYLQQTKTMVLIYRHQQQRFLLRTTELFRANFGLLQLLPTSLNKRICCAQIAARNT